MENLELLIPAFIGLLLLIFGLLIYFGKGLILIAGYNTLTKEEKEKIDKNNLSKKTGISLIKIGALSIIFGMSLKYLSKYTIYFVILFIVIVLTESIVLIYSVNKK